jgi:hypothetical protein
MRGKLKQACVSMYGINPLGWPRSMRAVMFVCVLLLSFAPTWAKEPPVPKILFHDSFDDGDPLINANGVGGGWRSFPVARHRVVESDNGLSISLGTEHASYALKQESTLDFWNCDGVVAEFVIKGTTVRSAHTWDFCNAYVWQFGIVSADFDRNGFPWHGSWFKEGAMWFTLGRRDTSDEAQFSVSIYSKFLENDGKRHPGIGTPGYARPVVFRFKIKYPAIARIKLDIAGWSFELPGQDIGARQTAFNWSSDLGSAAITTEFQRGTWMMLHARVLGLTAAGRLNTPLHSGDNEGNLECVTVRRWKS